MCRAGTFGWLAVGLVLVGSSAQADVPAVPWVSLFDGKTLAGWTQKGGTAKYAVKDGTIVGTTVPNTKNSFLCTQRSYGDFILEVEFTADPALNSGIQIRGQSRADYQDGRVHGYQVEIDPDVKRGRNWTGGLYDEGRRGWLVDLKDNEAGRKAFLPDQWNSLHIEAIGDSIRIWLNGVPTADARDSTDLDGFIGLQVHQVGGREDPLEVRWRNIRIQDLGRRHWVSMMPELTKSWSLVGSGTSSVVPGGGLLLQHAAEDRHAGLVTSSEPLGDYTVRAEVRQSAGNGGLYLLGQAATTEAGVRGLQIDFDARAGLGGLYETGGRGWLVHATPAPKPKAKPPAGDAASASAKPLANAPLSPSTPLADGWSKVTASVHGSRVVVHVDHRQVAALDDPKLSPSRLLAFEVAGDAAAKLEVRKVERLSEAVLAPVPGAPIGWCLIPNGSTAADAKTAGFEQIEIALQDVVNLPDPDFDRLATRLHDVGLPVLSGYNLFPDKMKLIGKEADRAKEDELFARVLPRLQKLGLTYVVFNSGPSRRAPEELAPAEARKQLVDFSRRFARAAAQHKLTVLLEPLRASDTNQVTTIPEALEVIRAVNAPNFQLLVDYSFMTLAKEPLSVLDKARGHLRHVWIANPDGRGYPMKADEADYGGFFAALRRIGYHGGVSVHARTDDFFADAARALTLLRVEAARLVAPAAPSATPIPTN